MERGPFALNGEEMIALPSGRLAGITSIRARYHALRLNRVVSPETPLHELRRLVDIVKPPAAYQWLPGSHTSVFSGYTLDELPGLSAWSLEDRKAFTQWIEQETQQREIEQARRRLVSDELPLVAREYVYPQRLYSGLQRRIEGLSLRRATPQQWRQTLLNLRRQGVREEELLWSGLLRFLEWQAQGGNGLIERTALLSAIDFSAIRLSLTNELASDQGGGLEFIEVPQSISLNRLGAIRKIAGPGEVSVLRYVDSLHYYKVGYLKRIVSELKTHNHLHWFALDTIGNLILPAQGEQPFFASKQEEFKSASRHALQHVGLPVAYSHCRRYEHKTLCGGSDYREWLLSLPDYPLSYFNSHYYERNLLLHFRTKTRSDLRNRRLLFIEEIQSDWHQSGAVLGYQNRWPGRLPPAPFSNSWVGLALKLILLHAADGGFDGIAWTRGEVQESHYLRSLVSVRRLYDEEIPRCLERLCRPWQVRLETTGIETKEPRLNISRQQDKWLVTDAKGRFSTRPRSSQREAMQLMARHCRRIELEVPVLLFDECLRKGIMQQGFPLFGESPVWD